MAQSQCLRKGSLLKCPQKIIFKQKWQSRWFVLYGNSEHGRVRLEYYDNEKAWQAEKGKRVIPLGNCVSIKPIWNKEYHHVLEIVIQDKTIQLAAAIKDEEKAWFKDLCKAVFGTASRNSIIQVVDKPSSELDFGYHSLDRSSLEGASGSPRPLHTVEESVHESSEGGSRDDIINRSASSGTLNNTSVDGRLQKTLTSSVASELSSLVSFESGFDDASSMTSTVTEGSTYPVTVRPTLASQKAGMNGTYLLQVSSLNITLIDIPTQGVICEWPIQYLRRYGRGRTKFSFEASEKCNHGKGVYTFNTLEGDSIFHLVDMYARGISMRNQMIKKRTSVPEGFRPLANASKKLHHSEGKLLDRFTEREPATPRYSDSTHDILSIGPLDSVSQAGTLPKCSQINDEAMCKTLLDTSLQDRGMSIGSGISLEVAQNISHKNNDKLLDFEDKLKDAFDSSFEEETPRGIITNSKKVEVSVIEEETLVDTLESEAESEQNLVKVSNEPAKPVTETVEESMPKKTKSVIKRSSSLKLTSALRRSSSCKDSSIKKSSSVKRSSSFRNRFFKGSKSTDDSNSKKLMSKSEHDLTVEQKPAQKDDIDVQIAQQERVKDILAKAIEDDMNRNSETEFLVNGDLETNKLEKSEQKTKRRKLPIRHKSNEMVLNTTPNKAKFAQSRLSSSFAGYDYKGQVVLSKTNSVEKDDEDELRKLQRRTQSVMKKVELYESLKRQAEEGRVNTYTFWRRKTKEGKTD